MSEIIPDQPTPKVTKQDVISTPVERFSAAWEAETIRTNAWGVWDDARKDLLKEVGESVFNNPDAFQEYQRGLPGQIRSQANDVNSFLKSIQADPNIDPKVKGVSPVDQAAFEGELNRRMTERYEEARRILRQAPNDAFAIETLAGFARAATDEVGISTGVIGLLTGGTSVGLRGLVTAFVREGAFGGVGEALTLSSQYEAAERLGIDEPDALTQIATGAAFGGAFVVGGKLVSTAYGRITGDRIAAQKAQTKVLSPLSTDRDISREAGAENAVTTGDWSKLPDDDRTPDELAAGTVPARETINIIPEEITVDYFDRLAQVESSGNPNAKASTSSAAGLYQFTTGTWKNLSRTHPELGLTPDGRFDIDQQNRAIRAFTEDNRQGLISSGIAEPTDGDLYLAHFLGLGGARNILSADPSQPISKVVGSKVIAANRGIKYNGKSFSQFTAQDLREWASAKLNVPAGSNTRRRSILASGDGPATGQFISVRPSEVLVDASAYQFKGGINDAGEDGTLTQILNWNDRYAGEMIFHERMDGTIYVADGHQRHGAATRLEAKGSDPIFLRGHVLREADGWSAEMAMVEAAAKNIAAGSGDALDQARVLRAFPEYADGLTGNARARDAVGLAKLGDETWGLAINKKISPQHASIIGEATSDPAEQIAIARSFMRSKPSNLDEARFMARDAVQFGMTRSDSGQASLFGDDFDGLDTLLEDRAKVANGAERYLRNNRSLFQTLTRNADRAEAGGNTLNRTGNAAAADEAAELVGIIRSLANRAGPVSDALNRAATVRRESGDDAGIDVFIDFLKGTEIDALVQGERIAVARRNDGGPDSPSNAPPEPPELDLGTNIEARVKTADAGYDRAQELVGGRQQGIAPEDDLADLRKADESFLNEEFEIDGQLLTAKSAISSLDEDQNFLEQLNQCRG